MPTYEFADGLGHMVVAQFLDGEVGIYRRTPGPPDGAPIDVDFSRALPQITAIRLTPDANGRPHLSVTAAGDLDQTDAGLIHLSWPGAGGDTLTWALNVPPGSVELDLPDLPAYLRDVRPTMETAFGPVDVTFWEADFIDGHDGNRRGNWFDVFGETIYFMPTELELRYTRGVLP